MTNAPSINLTNHNGFKWHSNSVITIKGYFFDSNNILYENANTLEFFKKIDNEAAFLEIVRTLNGIYTIIISINNQTLIATDTSRIFPLFYGCKKHLLFIADNIQTLKKEGFESEYDKDSETEFKSSGYILGKKTLLKNCFQTQSSEYLIFEENKLKKQGFYFSYSTNNTHNFKYDILKDKTIKIFEATFKRLEQSLNKRQVVIPLSGGYDSRLIAVMLKKMNYKNVVCFTYGKKNSKEINLSRLVAKELNFKWYFIEYTDELVKGYLHSKTFKEYINFTTNYTSMPFLQEYFSVKYLKKNKLINDSAIFIPGHSGDFLGGSQFRKVIPVNLKTSQISSKLLRSKFDIAKLNRKEKVKIKSAIETQLIRFVKNINDKLAYSVFEDFDMKEKISKFILNSSNVYNFFGYEQRFPFWDKELLVHFKKIPLNFKLDKMFYDDILTNHYFMEHNVNFKNELQPSINQVLFQNLKNKIKPLFPYSLKHELLVKKDSLNSHTMINDMLNDMKAPVEKYKSFNEVIIKWYLEASKKSIHE
jgi:asparagine synthase (glutamine-hydrolysing)